MRRVATGTPLMMRECAGCVQRRLTSCLCGCGPRGRYRTGGCVRKGTFTAVQDMWLSIPDKQLFCLLGHNGAGAWPLA